MSDYAIIQERNAQFMRALIQILSLCDASIYKRKRDLQDLLDAFDAFLKIRDIILDLFTGLDLIERDAGEIEDDAQDAGAQLAQAN